MNNDNVLHQREAAAINPLLQSVISAGVMFVLALVIGIAFHVREPFMPSLVVAVVTLALVWFGRLWQWLGLTARIEEATGLDLPGGMSADEIENLRQEFASMQKTLHVEHRYFDRDGGLASGDSTIEDGELVFAIANALYNQGLPFSVRKLCEQNKVISRADYDRLTADERSNPNSWLKRDGSGYLIWKNANYPDLGVRPTAKGEAMLRAALAGSPPANRQ